MGFPGDQGRRGYQGEKVYNMRLKKQNNKFTFFLKRLQCLFVIGHGW